MRFNTKIREETGDNNNNYNEKLRFISNNEKIHSRLNIEFNSTSLIYFHVREIVVRLTTINFIVIYTKVNFFQTPNLDVTGP